MLDQAMNALSELRILDRGEIGAGIFVGKDPASSRIVRTHAADGRDADPHSGSVRRVGDDGMQAQSTCPRLPAFAGRVVSQPGIEIPGHATISADPQAGWINACIDRSGFTGSPRFDHPDVVEFQPAAFRKLYALFRLMPALTKVVAITQEHAEEITIIGSKQAAAIALIEGGIVDTVTRKPGGLDIPCLPIARV